MVYSLVAVGYGYISRNPLNDLSAFQEFRNLRNIYIYIHFLIDIKGDVGRSH